MFTLHKQLSSNTDVKMFVIIVWESVIRTQCATTEAMALIANLNLNYFRRFTHNDNHFTCESSVVHELVQQIGHRWMQVIHYIEYITIYSITYMYVTEYIVM